jgi:uncharacterized membrane protein (UPF0136 family)
MTISRPIPVSDGSSAISLGLVLLVVGLLGHLFAAQGIGGSYVAYRDHIVGFVLLSVVSGAIIASLGWRFWRGRRDLTVLVLGGVQAVLGLVVYIERLHLH